MPLFRLSTALVVLLSTASVAAEKDNPKCDPHPVFSRFPGERLSSCDRSRFSSLELWGKKDPDDPKAQSGAFKVEGEYWYYFNDLEKNGPQYPGKLEVQRNFENAVRAAKGQVLGTNSGLVTFRVKKGDDEFWGESGCGRGGDDCTAVMHKLVRVVAMHQSVVVTAEQIAKSIEDEGKAVFYGLYFDTDKAELKPESTATLVEMAKWLKDNPDKKVFIVGHTDMQGSLTHNQGLSKARAAAVVEALVKKHGIKADRLASDGVGPYAPLSNNTAEKGRAKNRRVEMVLR